MTISKVEKKSGDILLTHKAFNGRIIMEWLAYELHTALASGLHPNHRRLEFCSVVMNLVIFI